MEYFDWSKEIQIPVTITDANGIIIYMNDKSAEKFADRGGRDLIGKNLGSFHNDNSNRIIQAIMTEHKPNVYTVEKDGITKLNFQAPYFKNGEFAGIYEISIELPEDMPYFNKDNVE